MLNSIPVYMLKKIDSLAFFLSPLVELVHLGTFSEDINSRPLILRPGGMGDLICVTMALEALGFETYAFDWVVEKRSAPWLDEMGASYFCYDELSLRELYRLGRSRDLIINTEQYYGLSQVFARWVLSSAGKLSCFGSNKLSQKATVRVPFNEKKHEVTNFYRLFSNVLGEGSGERITPVRCKETDLSSHILLGIGGGGEPSRTLMLETWLDLLDAHSVDSDVVYVSGAKKDSELVAAIVQARPWLKPVYSSFESFIGILKSAKKVITVDSGVVHAASYFGIPTVALYTSGVVERWAPLAKGSRIIKNSLECQPCTFWGQPSVCKNNYLCKEIDNYLFKGEVPPSL